MLTHCSTIQESPEPRLESEQLIQHLHHIQSSAHAIVSAHAAGEVLPNEPSMALSHGSTTGSVQDAQPALSAEATPMQNSVHITSDSGDRQPPQPLRSLPMSLAHFAEFGHVPPDPAKDTAHHSWSTYAAIKQSTGAEADLNAGGGKFSSCTACMLHLCPYGHNGAK